MSSEILLILIINLLFQKKKKKFFQEWRLLLKKVALNLLLVSFPQFVPLQSKTTASIDVENLRLYHILTLIAAGNERPSQGLTVLYVYVFKQVIMTLQLPQLSGGLSVEPAGCEQDNNSFFTP